MSERQLDTMRFRQDLDAHITRGPREPKAKRKTEAQLCMEGLLTEIFGNFQWCSEMQFCERKWRFDFAVGKPAGPKAAIEIEGGIWVNGRHTRGKGYQSDLDKYNTAASLGWTVFRFSTKDVLTGKAASFLRAWLDGHRA